jgi:hypothetical protein
MDVRKRFEEKVERLPWSGCWVWVGAISDKGYGNLSFGTPPKRKRKAAHRVSYELHVGSIPKGFDVCHRCDITTCVNPNHLFVGTAKDNVLDAVAKGRWITEKRRASWKRLRKGE